MRDFVHRLSKDEEGGSLLEYTVLVGIMLVTVIATIIVVGQWVSLQWRPIVGIFQ
jgi:pilus assembly protein Flp/PilA